jgi:hypothetical protein
VHAAYDPPSSLHANVEPDSDEANDKDAEVDVVDDAGCAVIVVCGGVRSRIGSTGAGGRTPRSVGTDGAAGVTGSATGAATGGAGVLGAGAGAGVVATRTAGHVVPGFPATQRRGRLLRALPAAQLPLHVPDVATAAGAPTDSSATQAREPDASVTVPGATATRRQPAAGLAKVPEASSAPGRPPASAYQATTSLPFDALASFTPTVVSDPVGVERTGAAYALPAASVAADADDAAPASAQTSTAMMKAPRLMTEVSATTPGALTFTPDALDASMAF